MKKSPPLILLLSFVSFIVVSSLISTLSSSSLSLQLLASAETANYSPKQKDDNPVTGEGPNLGENRISQDDITGGLSLKEIQNAGLRIFATPFNRYDGYGDGPFDPSEGDPREPGNRPSLQGNGTFLRVNGLDGQTCLECHFITRNSTIPLTFGIGGIAAGANHPIFKPSFINVADGSGGQVPYTNPGDMNGRFINPPFLFGSGGIELVAKEMTLCLQNLKREAIAHPGTVVPLEVKGVNFGTIVYNQDDLNGSPEEGILDTSAVEGVDKDLVVRPFGRKGEFATIRAFDLGAMQFHFGMQPVEVVGENNDNDHDGFVNELLVGEVSALHVFLTTRPKPIIDKPNQKALEGFKIFNCIGCVGCHKPFFITHGRTLTYSFPEVETNPKANVFYQVDLKKTARFIPSPLGGILVPAFSDLKRHDMGDALAESFDLVSDQTNREFITARLWGLRDTAPYLHDGRATTITDAILAHGGEAQAARNNFDALSQNGKDKVIAFLYLLRTPPENGQASFEEELFSVQK